MVDACDSYTSPNGTLYTSSAQFSDTLMNAAGCDSIVDIDLTVNSSAADTIVPSACVSYTSPGGQVLTTSGVYFDSLLTGAGCDSVLRIELTVQQVDTSVSRNGFTLTAQSATGSFQWVNCNGNLPIPTATNASFTPAANGSYAVIVTENGCSDTSDCRTVTVVGLSEAWSQAFQVWPSPAVEQVQVLFPEWIASGKLEVMDLQGRILSGYRIENATEWVVPTAEFASGMYVIRVTAGDKVARLRFARQ